MAKLESGARQLATRRRQARERMSIPFYVTPTTGQADDGDERRTSRRPYDVDEEASMLAGRAIHAALERWDLSAEPAAEFERQREKLRLGLERHDSSATGEAARRRVEAILDRMAGGVLLERLRSVGPRVIARELPLLLPPSDPGDSGDPSDPGGAVGFVSGVLDLLYRDPERDELVVVDFKTDRVESARDVARLAERYRPQGAIYLRAVEEFFRPDRPVRFELWSLWADAIVPVSAPRISPGSLGP